MEAGVQDLTEAWALEEPAAAAASTAEVAGAAATSEAEVAAPTPILAAPTLEEEVEDLPIPTRRLFQTPFTPRVFGQALAW
jgi:hypothetical protein